MTSRRALCGCPSPRGCPLHPPAAEVVAPTQPVEFVPVDTVPQLARLVKVFPGGWSFVCTRAVGSPGGRSSSVIESVALRASAGGGRGVRVVYERRVDTDPPGRWVHGLSILLLAGRARFVPAARVRAWLSGGAADL